MNKTVDSVGFNMVVQKLERGDTVSQVSKGDPSKENHECKGFLCAPGIRKAVRRSVRLGQSEQEQEETSAEQKGKMMSENCAKMREDRVGPCRRL